MREHAMAVIEASGMSAVQAAVLNVKQMRPAYEARGTAVAETLINECKAQSSGTWTRFYRDVLGLEAFGRAAFRSRIAKEVKQGKADKGDPLGTAAQRSAKIRLSEFTQITKALDAGVEFKADWSFHYAVGVARTGLAAKAEGGKRGRKAKPFLDKLKAFLVKNATTPEDKAKAVEFTRVWAQVQASKQAQV